AAAYSPGLPGEGQWTAGYLFDVIHTRDPWMHRIDICRAIGREPVLSVGHDGRILADVVADWASRHGRPFTLTLTGPAGGWGPVPSLGAGGVGVARAARGRGRASGRCARGPPSGNPATAAGGVAVFQGPAG